MEPYMEHNSPVWDDWGEETEETEQELMEEDGWEADTDGIDPFYALEVGKYISLFYWPNQRELIVSCHRLSFEEKYQVSWDARKFLQWYDNEMAVLIEGLKKGAEAVASLHSLGPKIIK